MKTYNSALITQNSPQARYPLIADVCYKAGFIDSWGRGIEKITEACKKAGLPEPTFIERSGGMVVELHSRVAVSTEISGETRTKTRTKTRVKTRVKTSIRILSILKENNSATREELAKKIGLSVKGIDWQINKLKQQGKIRRKGPAREGYWEVISAPTPSTNDELNNEKTLPNGERI